MDGPALEFVDGDVVAEINWDDFFNELPQLEVENLLQQVDADADVSSASLDSWINEMETLLMNDNDHNSLPQPLSDSTDCSDQFLSDILVESHGDSHGQTVVDHDVAHNSNPCDKNITDAGLDEGKVDATNESADDPISKKRKRQMRNRDAAVRSRERKKDYVKNLEMKSRYLEGECRRLGHLLQCCYAENHALRLCLQSGSAFGAPMTKLESAVLLLESLLLVSLLWFMGITCQLSLALVLLLTPQVVPPENVGQKGLRRLALKGGENKILKYFTVESFVKSRRCRASRTKMKSEFLVFFFKVYLRLLPMAFIDWWVPCKWVMGT